MAIVGFSGNLTRPSKTRTFVEHVVGEIALRYGRAATTYDINDLGAGFGNARRPADLDTQAAGVLQRVVSSEVLVVGTPTFKGSYTGLFKHFFDLVDPLALKGKPVVLLATGGGQRHALVVEHQLRPLFGFFEALALPTAVYAAEKDFVDGVLASEAVLARTQSALADLDGIFAPAGETRVAAE